jgi:hypothetical protein
MEDIPEEFKCIATGNIMDDPVTCDDGYTYDRNSIVNLCHMISAKTFKKISTLIPNRALKTSIDRFKHEKNCSSIEEIQFLKKDRDDIPEEFKCCVTGYLMNDPVTCDDGYTYDNYSIVKLCKMISAKTYKRITTIIPNRALKSSIDRFKQDKINILIKKLDILLKHKQGKEEKLLSIKEQINFTDAQLASIKSYNKSY